MKPTKQEESVSETTAEKGAAFEKRVARWAKRQFKLKEVKLNTFFKGKILTRPIQVDVVGYTHSDWSGTKIYWFECKNKKATIKRTDIFNFKERANDVRTTSQGIFGGKSSYKEWDQLIFVSTSRFDQDAISFAKKNKIGCFYYDGRTFQEQKLEYVD